METQWITASTLQFRTGRTPRLPQGLCKVGRGACRGGDTRGVVQKPGGHGAWVDGEGCLRRSPVLEVAMPAHPSSFIAERRGQGGDGDGQGRIELWHVLSVVPDPRAARGIRHPLSTVLTLAVAAVAAGARSLTGISAWAADLPVVHQSRFGVGRAVPSALTFARVLAGVDADVLDAVLCAWTGARAGVTCGPVPLAVDGKTARGARRQDGSRMHLFAAVTHDGRPVGQVTAPAKGFEIAVFGTLLDRVDLHGRVVTADALHTQTTTAAYITGRGAHYLLTELTGASSQVKEGVSLAGQAPRALGSPSGSTSAQDGSAHVGAMADHFRGRQPQTPRSCLRPAAMQRC